MTTKKVQQIKIWHSQVSWSLALLIDKRLYKKLRLALSLRTIPQIKFSHLKHRLSSYSIKRKG